MNFFKIYIKFFKNCDKNYLLIILIIIIKIYTKKIVKYKS